MKNNKILLLSGMAVAIGSVTIAWLIGSGQESVEQLYGLDLPESNKTSATGSPAVKKLEARVTGLTERSDSIIGAQQKLAASATPELPAMNEAAQALEMLPLPAAGQAGKAASDVKTPQQASAAVTARPQDTTVIAAVATTEQPPLRKPDRAVPEAPASASPGTDSAASGQSGTRKPVQAATSKVVSHGTQDPVTGEQPAPSAAKQGPWVINIASSQDKADADRLAEKARSRDFPTDLQQVTVKGKQYWRVQITGFSTKEEARATAGTAKEALGLKDVWITTR
jgi:cell division septation protein DedD